MKKRGVDYRTYLIKVSLFAIYNIYIVLTELEMSPSRLLSSLISLLAESNGGVPAKDSPTLKSVRVFVKGFLIM